MHGSEATPAANAVFLHILDQPILDRHRLELERSCDTLPVDVTTSPSLTSVIITSISGLSSVFPNHPDDNDLQVLFLLHQTIICMTYFRLSIRFFSPGRMAVIERNLCRDIVFPVYSSAPSRGLIQIGYSTFISETLLQLLDFWVRKSFS